MRDEVDAVVVVMPLYVQVTTVQKYFRRMLAKCDADQLRLRARCQREREQLRLVINEVDGERRLQRDFQRRLNPRTKDDFELLYNAMEGQTILIDWLVDWSIDWVSEFYSLLENTL